VLFKVGSLTLKLLHTPGHRRLPPTSSAVTAFHGDALLMKGERTDFQMAMMFRSKA
jgi:hypothetical protein